jgi:hypothetical protein
MDQRVLRVSTAVQHKVLQHLVLHGPVGVRRQVIQEKHVVGALQTMFGTEVSVLRVSTALHREVLKQVLHGRVLVPEQHVQLVVSQRNGGYDKFRIRAFK